MQEQAHRGAEAPGLAEGDGPSQSRRVAHRGVGGHQFTILGHGLGGLPRQPEGIGVTETGSCRQGVAADRLDGPLVAGDGVIVTSPAQVVAGQVQVRAVAVGAAAEDLVQALEGGLGVVGVIQHEIDVAGEQQGVARLVTARCQLCDRGQQHLRRRGVARGETQLCQPIASTAGFRFGGVVGQQLVQGVHGLGQVAGAGVVGGGSQQGAGGELTLTVEPLHFLEPGGSAAELAQRRETVGPFTPGLGGGPVVGVPVVELLEGGHRLTTPLTAGVGPGQQQPGLGQVRVAGVVANELGEQLCRGRIVAGVPEQVAGQLEVVLGVAIGWPRGQQDKQHDDAQTGARPCNGTWIHEGITAKAAGISGKRRAAGTGGVHYLTQEPANIQTTYIGVKTCYISHLRTIPRVSRSAPAPN